MKKNTQIRSANILKVLALSAIVIILSIFSSLISIINGSVKRHCALAQIKYGGDCSFALTSFVKDKDNSFRSRNSAIWALGRLRDKNALPVLTSFYTGIIPDREPLDAGISQYELKKAILLIDKNADVSPKTEKTLKEKLEECLPLSNMESKRICDELVASIKSYNDCVEAGFPIQESYPEKCRTIDGRTFVNSK